jgi:hypothetical protein
MFDDPVVGLDYKGHDSFMWMTSKLMEQVVLHECMSIVELVLPYLSDAQKARSDGTVSSAGL